MSYAIWENTACLLNKERLDYYKKKLILDEPVSTGMRCSLLLLLRSVKQINVFITSTVAYVKYFVKSLPCTYLLINLFLSVIVNESDHL